MTDYDIDPNRATFSFVKSKYCNGKTFVLPII